MVNSNQFSTKIMDCLIVFDFDETIIDVNSDTYIYLLGPNRTLPEELKRFGDGDDWNNHMIQVFKYLHKHGCTEKDYRKLFSTIPLVSGFKELLNNLSRHSDRIETIILSDANSISISYILEHHKISHVFREILTNPAYFDETGLLIMKPYHEQHFCKISAANLCKGYVLQQYIAKRAVENVKFKRIFYAGDGYNDLCPSLTLTQNDYVLPRCNFPLHRLSTEKSANNEMKAKVVPFINGEDIWNIISDVINS